MYVCFVFHLMLAGRQPFVVVVFCGVFSCFVSFIWCQLFACLIRAAIFRLPTAFVVWSFFLCHRHLWSVLSFFFCHWHLCTVSFLHGLVSSVE